MSVLPDRSRHGTEPRRVSAGLRRKQGVESNVQPAARGGDPREPTDESRLFRFTLWHSILLASAIGVIYSAYAYVVPGWMPQP